MFDRIDSHFAADDESGRNKERRHLFQVLEANGYPKKFIQKTVKRAVKRRREGEPIAEKPKATVVIPYVNQISEKIKRILSDVGIRAVSKAKNWQWELCKGIKDAIPIEKTKGVVYEINCSDCDASYIGETTRSLEIRRKEHLRHTKNGKVEASAVADHVWNHDHRIDWDGARVLDKERNWTSRKIREALHIAKNRPDMNKDRGLLLSSRWTKLVTKK